MLLSSLDLLLVLFACAGAQSGTETLYIGFVATDSSTAAELTPPLKIALNIINNHSTVLPGYQLNIVPWLSECDRTTSLTRFLDIVLDRCNASLRAPTILGVVGCGCTEADLPVAELVHHWNIPQISYIGESSMVTDREQYRNYFLLHSMETVGRALQALLTEYGWTRLDIITHNSTRFLEAGRTIRTVLEETDQNVTQNHTILTPTNTIRESLDILKDDYRIFFLNTFPDTAREIFCDAIELNLVFPRYVWIINGWYASDWWVTMDTTGCSNVDIEQFLQASRVLVIEPYQTSDNLIIGGITREEYYGLYKEAVQASGTQFVPEHPLIYDSVWTLALALNSTLANQNAASNSCESSGRSLENFSYSSKGLGREIRDAVSRTSFNGASGEVTFNLNGIRRQDFVLVLQYRNGPGLVEIGSVDLSESTGPYNLTYAANQNSSTVFPGVIPMDGSPLKIIITFDLWIVGVCYTLAVIGLIFSLICCLFNVVFRKRKIVRLTSPNLNYFILLGSVLAYGTIFIYLIRTTDRDVYKIRCYVQTWTVTLAFVLMFGTVIAKLYRIAHIFKNPSLNRTSMKDWKLAIIIGLFVLCGILLLLLRLVVPQFRVSPSLSSNREYPNGLNELGIVETYCSWRCIGGDPVAFYYQLIYYFYLLVVLVLALVFALRTRKVKIKVLNDANWISAIVYITVPFVVIFFVFTFVLAAWVHLSAAIYCISIFILSTVFLGFVFIPKMVAFAKDPKGENIFAKVNSVAINSTNVSANGRRPTLETTYNDTMQKQTTHSNDTADVHI